MRMTYTGRKDFPHRMEDCLVQFQEGTGCRSVLEEEHTSSVGMRQVQNHLAEGS